MKCRRVLIKKIIIIKEREEIKEKLLKILWLKLRDDATRKSIYYNLINNEMNFLSLDEKR